MRNPLHIALGESASGCLRAACRSHGMPGVVLCIPDDLSHGPLDDGRARMNHMRRCFRGYEDWPLAVTDVFAPWRAMIERLDADKPKAILVWSGDNVSEGTFLAMACWWLRERHEWVLRATMSGRDGRHYVAKHTPAELADLFTSAQTLTDTERADFAEDFARMRAETGLLRRWEEGRIVGMPVDRYDSLLMECCATDWAPAARVVGTAMSRCDKRNLLSDLFFSSRLHTLIDSGAIEADGPKRRLREYAVRLTPPGIVARSA